MPTSYTPDLRLALPADGDLNGTWGQTVNNGITSLVDEAISGTATVAMADANQTLTSLNGATDQARCMFLNCTGAMTANRNVVCPAVSKLYFVTNSTTGGFSVVVKTSAGTGITVAAGKSAVLRCDGTNVVNGISSVPGGLAVDVTGNVTGTLNGNVSLPVEVDVASAATTSVGAAASRLIRITGTTPITSFGTTYNGPVFIRFAAATPLFNSSTLLLPGSANITTGAGDTCVAWPKATTGVSDGWVVSAYQSAARPAFLAQGATGATSGSLIEAATYANTYLNEGSNFNASTGRFTAPVDGLYFFQFTVQCNTAAGAGILGTLKVNSAGNAYGDTVQAVPATGGSTPVAPKASGTADIRLAAGDYVSVRYSVFGGVSCSISQFSGHLLHA